MLFTVSGGVQVLLPQDWMANDTSMCLDWLAGAAARSKGKGDLNITGFNQLENKIWYRKMENCTVLHGSAVKELFQCLNSFVICMD